MYDVAVIGGGVCGCALLYELSKQEGSFVLLEKENDISTGATKANSGIIHSGYDPVPGTLAARYNVRGNAMFPKLCEDLGIAFRPCGSLTLAFDEGDCLALQKLLENGTQNGVEGLRLLSKEEALALEPMLNPAIAQTLLAPGAGIISPWELCIALAETAVLNGAEIRRNAEVTGIRLLDGGFALDGPAGLVRAKTVVNAAGGDSAAVMDLLQRSFRITPGRGQYFLLDKNQGNLVEHIIFQCPGKAGKGVLVTPTIHGNLLLGPNAETAHNTATTAEGLHFVREMALRSVPSIDLRQCIRTFAGLRAAADTGDFIVGESSVPGFYNLAGIKSPGLSSAPALAEDLAKVLSKKLRLSKKKKHTQRQAPVRLAKLSHSQREALIRKDPAYGRIVCRCESVSEGEIRDALHSPVPPRSLDGVKRRTNAGMGRCQGGFCGLKVQKQTAAEQALLLSDIPLDREGMQIIIGGGEC